MDPSAILVALVLAAVSAVMSLLVGLWLLSARRSLSAVDSLKETVAKHEGDIRVLTEQKTNLAAMLGEVNRKLDELARKMDEFITRPRPRK